MQNQVTLLDNIAAELKAAYESHDSSMMSNYFLHNQSILVDIEELKSRLEARKVLEFQSFKKMRGEEPRLSAELLNTHDEITMLETDLSVEQCEVMKLAVKERVFRCVAVDKANAAGDCVLGRNSGGVESFIAAEGKNIHLFSLKNCTLKHVFHGDEESRLGKKLTRDTN